MRRARCAASCRRSTSSSPAPTRGRGRTAELLQAEAGWPAPEPCAALEAPRPPAAAVDVLAERDGSGSIALVGHEPFLSSLASLLLTADAASVRVELKKGGVALLSFDERPAPGGAVLRWHVTPKLPRSLDGARS